MTVYPSTLRGRISVPSSKSITHRAYMLASKAAGSKVLNPLVSQDTNATLNCLKLLGAEVEGISGGYQFTREISHGSKSLNCENSGTTLRLLTGICATLDQPSILMGDDSLNTRPVADLVEALNIMGAKVKAENGCPPVFINHPVTKNKTRVSGSISSQFISSLLLNAAFGENTRIIEVEKPVVSSPYITLTIQMLDELGVQIKIVDNDRLISHEVRPSGWNSHEFTVPADYSSAAFFIAAGIMGDNDITIDNISDNYEQADRRIIEHLQSMGGDIKYGETLRALGSDTSAASLSLHQSPDIFPILCVVMAVARGQGELCGAHHLKYKESNRITTTVEMLNLMGVDIIASEDGAVIRSDGIKGGVTINPHNDHRIAMAAAIAATQADNPVTILNPDCVAVSYPDFFEHLKKLGARLRYNN